ncbi:MAG: hypothetical protein J7539_07865 [Niabella sp.]|nr:hypothetical protein [Niabella sp.]
MRRLSIKGSRTTDPVYRTIVLLLGALWLVSGILIVPLFISPRSGKDKEYRRPSVDSMLLSLNDLKVNGKATLINLQLKEVSQPNAVTDNTGQTVADKRKKIYNRLLEEKTKPPEPARHEGFTIKQVPQ